MTKDDRHRPIRNRRSVLPITGALVAMGLSTWASAAAMPEAVSKEGFSVAQWETLAAGELVSLVRPSAGKSPETYAAGAVVIGVPWQHAFEQISRVEEMPEYSSCLKAMQVLMRVKREGGTSIKTRETHQSLWITAHYTLDYQADLERKEIRWQLDPGANNDVTRMSGVWRFIPLDQRTLVTYRVVGSSGRALPAKLEDYFASLMLPGFLKGVRKHVEDAHARGEH